MNWNAETQRRFDELRVRELEGPLTGAEREELAALVAAIEADEARYLAPAIDQMQRDEHAEVAQLTTAQIRSESLAALVQQHEHLLAEARAWLASFDQRRLVLQDHYSALTGEPLPSGQRR